MIDPELSKKRQDAEYVRRYDRLFFFHALSLLPLLVFVAVTFMSSGQLVWMAVYASGVTYLVLLAVLRFLWRREVLKGMREEGAIDSDYKPPVL
ncbi:hypothetical protein [Congregibacter sp.]|uniref:hypothetical protein n=1 Tax=Congregibacter sp. TaxID=2744308 RepID=UPI003F6B82A7